MTTYTAYHYYEDNDQFVTVWLDIQFRDEKLSLTQLNRKAWLTDVMNVVESLGDAGWIVTSDWEDADFSAATMPETAQYLPKARVATVERIEEWDARHGVISRNYQFESCL